MKYIKFKKSYSSGFTIIETLVAITILMIAIAGPITIAKKGLNASLYARDQVTASFLAQDMMESIKNDERNSWTISPSKCHAPAILHIQPNGTYATPSPTPNPSKFTIGCTVTYRNDDDITVTITVTWNNGTISNSMTLTNEMYNINL